MAIAPRVRLLVAFLLAAAAAQAPLAQEPQSGALDVAPQTGFTEPRETCGTDFLYLRSLGLTTATPLADGEPLMADQSPQILTADHSGNFTVTIQMVGVYSNDAVRAGDQRHHRNMGSNEHENGRRNLAQHFRKNLCRH